MTWKFCTTRNKDDPQFFFSHLKTKLLAFVLFAGIFSSASALTTTSDMLTAIRLRIRDTSSNTSRQRFSDTQLTTFVNEGHRDVINNTWVLSQQQTITLVSGTTRYAFSPVNVISLLRVTLDHRELTETTKIKLDSDYGGNWELTSGKPQQYYQDTTQPSYILFYPWPANSSSTGTIIVSYVSSGFDISLSTQIPFNEEPRWNIYADLIVLYSCYRVFLIEGEVDKATTYYNEYQVRLKNMRDMIGRFPNYNPGLVGGGGR